MNRIIKFGVVSSLLMALLAGCGGGDDKTSIASVVSFGDSLSDVGTYKVGTVAALNGGKFTVNGTGGNVWTEFLAARLNTPSQCAARTGMLPNAAGVTGGPVQDFANCFNYAQGSSRVTSSGTGPNGVALQQYGQMNLGFMADSLNDQFNRHLTKAGGAYAGRELVTVNAGGNDLFVQLEGVVSAAAGGAQAVAAGTIAGWSQSTIGTVTLGGSAASNAAATAAVMAMGQAGIELAGYIKTLVIGKGAKYVLVRTLGDVNLTPFGLSLDAGTRSLITAMTQAFDGQLKAGLDGTSGVIILDDYALTTDVAANPGKYGFTNVTMQSCGPNAFSSSLVCNTGNLIAGDTSHYAFADSVHPTPYSHQKEAEIALALLDAAGWH